MFEKLTEKLKENNFQVTCFESAAEAAEYLDRTIDKKTVAIGGSHTVQEMGLYPLLESHNLIYYTASRKHSAEEKSLLWKASMGHRGLHHQRKRLGRRLRCADQYRWV